MYYFIGDIFMNEENLIKYYNYQLKYYSLNNCNISYKILISPKFANKLI